MAKQKKTATKEMTRPAKEPKGFAMPAVRGSAHWQEWVRGLLEHDRSDWPDLVDKALVAYAKQIGFKTEAPRR
jgi:hypothetical protein